MTHINKSDTPMSHGRVRHESFSANAYFTCGLTPRIHPIIQFLILLSKFEKGMWIRLKYWVHPFITRHWWLGCVSRIRVNLVFSFLHVFIWFIFQAFDSLQINSVTPLRRQELQQQQWFFRPVSFTFPVQPSAPFLQPQLFYPLESDP